MIERPQKVANSLMHSIVNSYSSDDLIQMSETMLDSTGDSLLKSDMLTKIPVLGILAAFAKGVLTFRDLRYVSKLLSFLSETSKASDVDRSQYQKKLDNNPKESQKAGSTILDIVDKFTSTEKAIMAGKVMRAFMHEVSMGFDQIVYLCEIIDRAHLDDLISLEKNDIHNDSNLEAVGIKKPMRVEDINIAIKAAMDSALSKIPILKEGQEYPTGIRNPTVTESGLTEEGANLQRILRNYT